MADVFVAYTPNNTGVSAGNNISSTNEKNDRAAVKATVDALNAVGADMSSFKYSTQTQTYIRDFDITQVTTGANSIAIASGATTLYYFTGDSEQTSWGALTSTDVTAISNGVIWAIYPGKTYTITDNLAASRPADSFRVATFTNVAGTVTVTGNWQTPLESKSCIFEEDCTFRKDLTVKENLTVDGDTTVTGDLAVTGSITGTVEKVITEIDNTDSPYTLLPATDILLCDTSSGAITVNYYTAVGAVVKEVEIKNIGTSTNFVTIDPDGAETIERLTTLKLYAPDDSAKIYPDGTNLRVSGGLKTKTLIETQTASNSSSIDFIVGVDSAFTKYFFEYYNVVPQTDNTGLRGLVTQDGGSNWLSTGYQSGAYGAIQTGAGGGLGSTTYFVLSNNAVSLVGSAAGESVAGEFTLIDPSNSSLHKKIYGSFVLSRADGNMQEIQHGGHYSGDTNAINGFRFIMSSGNIASGTFKLYGLR